MVGVHFFFFLYKGGGEINEEGQGGFRIRQTGFPYLVLLNDLFLFKNILYANIQIS